MITLLTIGKPKERYIQTGVEEFSSRIAHFATFRHLVIKEGKSKDEEAARIRDAAKSGHLVLLDEHGRMMTSTEFSAWLARTQLAHKDLVFAVGGADGHDPSLKKDAVLLSLSPMTLPHEMAALVFCEQLYRAFAIQKNLPYHREG